ncbi:MAG: hypothetical protein QM490_00065 [Candidatus Gracilibacteria bacterium]
MKIIISDIFNKKYLHKLSRYFSVLEFSDKLKNYNNNICLKYPHFKFKLKIKSVEFRGVILIKDNKYIIPLIICLKKNKNCGENIIWTKYEKEILIMAKKVLLDIETKKYEVY